MLFARRLFLQSAVAAFVPQDVRFSTNVKVVTLFATVRDHKGRIINDLDKSDFRLTEEGRPQEISYFSRESDLPLKIGILIDTSRSQYGILESERRASYTFLDRVLREGKDTAFISKFDVDVTMLQGFTSSRHELQVALQAADLPRQVADEAEPSRQRILLGTKLLDAVREASHQTLLPEQGRKALILLTDGVDAGSRTNVEGALRNAQRADAVIYSILYFDPRGYPRARRTGRDGMPVPVARRGQATLKRLSGETGGSFFLVSKKEPVEQIYDRIQDELRHQYSLGYTPDTADAANRYRKIQVSVTRKNLSVRARDGYFL